MSFKEKLFPNCSFFHWNDLIVICYYFKRDLLSLLEKIFWFFFLTGGERRTHNNAFLLTSSGNFTKLSERHLSVILQRFSGVLRPSNMRSAQCDIQAALSWCLSSLGHEDDPGRRCCTAFIPSSLLFFILKIGISFVIRNLKLKVHKAFYEIFYQ